MKQSTIEWVLGWFDSPPVARMYAARLFGQAWEDCLKYGPEVAKLRKQLAKARFRIRRTRGFCHAGSTALRAYKIARQQPTACNLRGLYRYYAELSGYQLEGLAKLDAIQRHILERATITEVFSPEGKPLWAVQNGSGKVGAK